MDLHLPAHGNDPSVTTVRHEWNRHLLGGRKVDMDMPTWRLAKV